jgi:omega-amidase
MSTNIHVSCIQADLVWENKEVNFANFEEKFKQLPDETQLVILPEMFSTGFSMKPEDLSEPANGKTINWLKKQASLSNKIIIGSIIISDSGNNYNRLVTTFPDGKQLFYDKRHLFRMGDEHVHYSAGDKKLIFQFNNWSICPLICYDLRFPVWSRNRNNYDILIYIANWPEARSYVWKSLLIARAIENMAFVIGVNRVGADKNGVNHSGESMIINPYGKVIAQAGANIEEILNAELSFDELERLRKKFPVHLDADEFEIKT